MVLLALGIDHKTAPQSMRERAAFAVDEIPQALRSLRAFFAHGELALLSTCNRTEIYAKGVAVEDLWEWWQAEKGLDKLELETYSYIYEDQRAIQHIMRLACGLESMVLGEPQILGQLKSAQLVAQKEGMLGKYLNRLLQSAFAVAKRVRTDTEISKHPVSIAYLAVRLAEQIFENFGQLTVLLVGAGETSELCAEHFSHRGVQNLIIANRSIERAKRLAERFDSRYIDLGSLDEALACADIVITATGSSVPLLDKNMLEVALKKRKQKPMFLIDLAMPRNINNNVRTLGSVYLYTIEELKQLVEKNKNLRNSSVEQAEHLIAHHAQIFLSWLRTQTAVYTLDSYRRSIEAIKAQELELALFKIAQGASPEDIIRVLAHNLSQKFLHLPTIRLREAGAKQNFALLETVHQLFIKEV